MRKYIIFIAVCISIAVSFQVGIDFNTFSAQELTDAINHYGHVDFTWAITVNSPGVSAQLWRQAFATLNNKDVFSEDNPM
jgi:hypothetical protein